MGRMGIEEEGVGALEDGKPSRSVSCLTGRHHVVVNLVTLLRSIHNLGIWPPGSIADRAHNDDSTKHAMPDTLHKRGCDIDSHPRPFSSQNHL